jgi:hypothetical protein
MADINAQAATNVFENCLCEVTYNLLPIAIGEQSCTKAAGLLRGCATIAE